jgi:KDO2-lipid IV(A) lauroyltransferase
MSTKVRLSHRAEYALFVCATLLARALGERGARRMGAAAGRLAWWPLGLRRRTVEGQLAAAFPEHDRAWIRATARACYAHFGAELFALLRLSAATPAEVLSRTEVDGLDALGAVLAQGRGVVLATGHLGNWEIGGAALASRGVPLDVVVQRQSNPLFDRAIVHMRERLGMRVIERGQAPRQALRSLRAGRVVGFVADQDARAAGVFVPFFGRPASTHRGGALLALRSGAAVFSLGVRRLGSRYRLTLAEVPVEGAAGDGEEAVQRLTAAFTQRLESAIRDAPEQYFWFHKRWKTRVAESAPIEEPPQRVPGI